MKRLLFLCAVFFLFSCLNNEEVTYLKLSEVLSFYSDLQQDEVIACAASSENDVSVTDVYYYPIPDAFDIQYYETNGVDVNPNDFSNYERKDLIIEDVFNGYMQKFVRTSNVESFCIVTYRTEGKFHKSNPIRLKHNSKPTEYNNAVDVDKSESLMPLFAWEDGVIKENEIYFQVISTANRDFISGTYTFDKWFQYYKLSNVVLNVNRVTPIELTSNTSYNFTMLAVSIDNWVNLVIEKPFVAQ